jgi:hypothetical protein
MAFKPLGLRVSTATLLSVLPFGHTQRLKQALNPPRA